MISLCMDIVETPDQHMNSKDQFLDKLVSQLSKEFGGQLSMVGVIDEKAKLMYSQKGQSSIPLNAGRENVLGVQLSLSFSMLKQIENLLGHLSHIVLTFDKHEVVLSEIVSNSIIYIICNKGSAGGIVSALVKFIGDEPTAPRNTRPDYLEDEWSSR
jgi:hypothetical protein